MKATDAETRVVYTGRVNPLRDSFASTCAGAISVPRESLRSILREFAKLSPRSKFPTSRMTSAETYNDLVELEHLGEENEHEDDAAVDAAGDDALPMEVDDAFPVYGPLTHDESLLEDIHTQGTRMIAEINQHLDDACSHGRQEHIWYLEDQLEWWTNVS